MAAIRQDITIEKGSRYYKKFQTTDSSGLPRSLEGKKIYCNMKESLETEVYLFQLTEANGGVVVVDDILGIFALLIDSDDTPIEANYGVYTIMEEDEINTETEDERLMEGKLEFTKGV